MLDYYKKPSYPQSSCPCEPCGENPTFTEHTDKNYRESGCSLAAARAFF